MPPHAADAPLRPGDRLPVVLLVGALLLGVLLRAWHYGANASLWLDELALANNVLPRSLPTLLTEPLDFAQVAPVGYILLLKGISWAAGSGELALRLPAFLAGVAALPLTALLSRELLGLRHAWMPTLLVAVSTPLVFQAAQVKPYSGDVLLALALLLVAVRAARASAPPRLPALAALGIMAPWFSFPALFALAAAGLALLLGSRRWTGRAIAPGIGLVLVLWAASGTIALAVAFTLVTEATSLFMQDFWSTGFPRIPPTSLADLLWPFTALTDLLRELGNFRGSRPLAVVTALGTLAWAVRGGRVALLILVPAAAAVAAATLHLYPLAARTALWALPLVAILLVLGTRTVLERLLPASGAQVTALLLPLSLGIPFLLGGRSPLPPPTEHPRPVLQHLVDTARPGDVAYIHYSGWQAWQYHAPRLGAAGPPAMIGTCSRADRGLPLRELQGLAGHDRVWVFLSHSEDQLREREMFARFLDAAGARPVEDFRRPTSSRSDGLTSIALLYDLRGARITGAAGDSLITAVLEDLPAPGPRCGHPFIPDSLDRSSFAPTP